MVKYILQMNQFGNYIIYKKIFEISCIYNILLEKIKSLCYNGIVKKCLIRQGDNLIQYAK